MRPQLDAWARQAAAVRAGGLRLACKLSGVDKFSAALLSPPADQVAARLRNSVRLGPVTGVQHDLASLLSSQPPSQILALPLAASGWVVDLRWCPAGEHLVVLCAEPLQCSTALRVCTFKGAQLVSSFVEPLAEHKDFCSLRVLDDAAAMILLVGSGGMHRVLASTAQGVVTARHPSAPIVLGTVYAHGGRLLAASQTGDRLFIYSACTYTEISLQRAPADNISSRISAWGNLAAVVLTAPAWSDRWEDIAHELALVDLARQAALHCVQLPPHEPRDVYRSSAAGSATLGARSMAVSLACNQIRVVATSGGEVGRELFSCSAGEASWDAVGQVLAFSQKWHGVSVRHGITGALLAFWSAHPGTMDWGLNWLPDNGGLAVQTSLEDRLSLCVLRFGITQSS